MCTTDRLRSWLLEFPIRTLPSACPAIEAKGWASRALEAGRACGDGVGHNDDKVVRPDGVPAKYLGRRRRYMQPLSSLIYSALGHPKRPTPSTAGYSEATRQPPPAPDREVAQAGPAVRR
jgi:hypothetical protein